MDIKEPQFENTNHICPVCGKTKLEHIVDTMTERCPDPDCKHSFTQEVNTSDNENLIDLRDTASPHKKYPVNKGIYDKHMEATKKKAEIAMAEKIESDNKQMNGVNAEAMYINASNKLIERIGNIAIGNKIPKYNPLSELSGKPIQQLFLELFNSKRLVIRPTLKKDDVFGYKVDVSFSNIPRDIPYRTLYYDAVQDKWKTGKLLSEFGRAV